MYFNNHEKINTQLFDICIYVLDVQALSALALDLVLGLIVHCKTYKDKNAPGRQFSQISQYTV